jgi:hypothetical protein
MRGIALRNASSLKTPEIAELLQFLATEFIIHMTLVIAPPTLNLKFRGTGMSSNWGSTAITKPMIPSMALLQVSEIYFVITYFDFFDVAVNIRTKNVF